ncbi:protein of unknown function [Nitrospina watsonii]|uniref:Uncharacterized protein n=1 Tax=Nitrospina watsonii TaxID=1323948 RepID=A0ABM9HFX3_9BACT|nr:protein of unknown function [Nitrospina watsonii]
MSIKIYPYRVAETLWKGTDLISGDPENKNNFNYL